jgi:hypothetical protein
MFTSKYSKYIGITYSDDDVEDSTPFLDETTPNLEERKVKTPLLRRILHTVWTWIKGSPFVTIVSIVQIITLLYSIYLNDGIESWSQNPMLGPSADVLIQMGAKDVRFNLHSSLQAGTFDVQ